MRRWGAIALLPSANPLNVTLKDVKPPVWGRLLAPSDLRLSALAGAGFDPAAFDLEAVSAALQELTGR